MPSGSVLPGASVTVKNTGTQISRETTTDASGAFRLLEAQLLVDATHQGNFESLTFEQGPPAEDPTHTDAIATGAPLEGDESAWEAGLLRTRDDEEEGEDEDEAP